MIFLALTLVLGVMAFYVIGKLNKENEIPYERLEDLMWCKAHHFSYHEKIYPERHILIWWGEDAEGKRYRPDEYGKPKELVNNQEDEHDNGTDPTSNLPGTAGSA